MTMESTIIEDYSNLDTQMRKVMFKDKLARALKSWLGGATGKLRFDAVMDYLERTDFFTAPASTRFHEAYEGGLCQHSLRVCARAEILSDVPMFRGVNVAQAVICALLHDIVKVNTYKKVRKNVKDPNTGAWSSVDAYEYDAPAGDKLGHGETSMVRAYALIPELTEEMLAAIRWHMGLWDCPESQKNSYNRACTSFPLVHLIQFADQLSITSYS